MKFSILFLLSLIIFACSSDSSTTNQIDNSVSQTQTSNNIEIKTPTPAKEQTKNNNSEDVISYISNQIFKAMNNGTLNNLDPSKL